MKRFAKSMLGVTLLEIMLVLAIAAMVIVMSVRYYQSATANQQANSILQMIQSVTANADTLAQNTGDYSSNLTTTNLQPMMPNNSLTIPGGGTIQLGTVGTSTYAVTVGTMPAQVCNQLRARLLGNTKYVTPACSGTTGQVNLTYTYDNTL